MSRITLDKLNVRIEVALNDLRGWFAPGVKLTVVAHFPDRQIAHIVTDDDLHGVMDAILRDGPNLGPETWKGPWMPKRQRKAKGKK